MRLGSETEIQPWFCSHLLSDEVREDVCGYTYLLKQNKVLFLAKMRKKKTLGPDTQDLGGFLRGSVLLAVLR